MEPQVEDTIIAKRSSSSKNFFHSLKIINFRCQFEIIQPKMSPCEQSELQSIPAGSLNKCTEALNNAINWQDQKWKSLNIRSTVGDCSNQAIEKAYAMWDKLNPKEWMKQNVHMPQVQLPQVQLPQVQLPQVQLPQMEPLTQNLRSAVGDCSNQAIEKAHAVWDKLNAKEWMNQNISIPQVKTMKPSLSMLSKAMIFLCLLPFLTVFLFTVTSLFMGLLGVMLFEGSLLTVASAVIGGILMPVLGFVSVVGGCIFALYHFGNKYRQTLKSGMPQSESETSAQVPEAPEDAQRLSVSEDLPESVPVAVDSQPEQSSEMEIPAQTVEDIVDDKKKTTAVTSRRNRTKGRNMFQLTNVSPPRSR